MSDVVVIIEISHEDRYNIPEGLQLVAEDSVEEPNGLVKLEDVVVVDDSIIHGHISGEKMLECEKKAGKRAGLRAARAFLRQQHLIPVEWRGKKVLGFMGTIVCDDYRNRVFPISYWDGARWCLRWRSIYKTIEALSLFRAVRCSRDHVASE